MASLDDLKEFNKFEQFKTYIKNFILSDEVLFKLVFYGVSNPLLLEIPENPYIIFEESNEHGCVLFKNKNSAIQNEEQTTILVDFYSVPKGNSKYIDSMFITFKIINKGINIQELENGLNRGNVIANLISNHFNFAKFNHLTKVGRDSYKELSINEQNEGRLLIFTTDVLANNLLDNVNYLKQNYGVDSRENI